MNEKVLIIDDEQDSIDSICDHLVDIEGITCRGETHPERAIESFQTNPADIVIVDFLLSTLDEMTGLDVIQQIRDIKPFTRFILISGFVPYAADHEKISEQLINQIKVDRYVRKPLDIEELSSMVKELLANVETVSQDWLAISEEYVSKGKVTAAEVRNLNEDFKKAILDAADKDSNSND